MIDSPALNKFLDDLIFQKHGAEALSVAVARAVEEYLQKPCGEITVDIAVTESGELYVLEANSKAMTRGMFEEAGNTDAEIACMAKPMMYATSISEFN